jgi:hypothetical protein
MTRARSVAIVAASVLVLAVTGCGTSGKSGSGFGAGPTTPPASSAPSPGPASSPTTTPPSDRALPPPAETDCALSQLDVSDTNGGAGSTHRATVLVFRNTSTTTCHLAGYPGVAALNGSDQQVAQAARSLSGYLGGAPAVLSVQLAPGQSASATVEALAIDVATGNSCTRYAGILVTPPNETHSVKLAWPNDGCSSLQVHPVVPGTTGSKS